MKTEQLRGTLQDIRRLARPAADSEPTDAQLLGAFQHNRDETAFAALVDRHAALVLGVCRRTLGDAHAAEDAFQATFLVLARQAGSIRRPQSLAPWLYGVAWRAAMKARRSLIRHRLAPLPADLPAAPDQGLSWSEALAVLDEEVEGLPERYRDVFILCCLQEHSRAETARLLGVQEGTVASRLARARHLLQQRLARRGVSLTAALAVVGLSGSVSPGATWKATQAALLLASGASLVGVVPASVLSLVRGVTRTLVLSRARTLLGLVLIAAGLIAAAFSSFAAPKTGPTPFPVQARTAVPETEAGTVTITGRVLADGKPVAGARVYYHFITREDEPVPVRAVTDAAGRFAFTLGKKDIPLSADAVQSDPLRTGQVVARAPGHTFAWTNLARGPADLTLHAAREETPVEGRIVDLEGRAIAGLRVRAVAALAPDKGDLSPFLAALGKESSFYHAFFGNLSNVLMNPLIGRHVALLPATTTDASGRFRLTGFAREQVVELRIEGPTIETQDVYVVTRPGVKLQTTPRTHDPFFGPGPQVKILATGFTLPVAPGQVVVGTVRDASTSKPIAGAIVESYTLAGTNVAQNTLYHTVTDARGQYRLTGLPRGRGTRIRVRCGKDHPYLPVLRAVEATPPFRPATVDVDLQPAVWVDILATDRATGKPVPGYVSYFIVPDKGVSDEVGPAYNHMMASRNDGTFRLAVAARRAILAFRANWKEYPIAREAAKVELSSSLSPTNFQAFAAIDPRPGAAPVKVHFTLDRGLITRGKLIGPDGTPVGGALGAALRHDWYTSAEHLDGTGQFTALGLDPARPRLLCFVHEGTKLAGSVIVRGGEPFPVTVRMRPWATVTGRLLDAAGKPITKAWLWFTTVPPRRPDEAMSLDTGLHVVDPSVRSATRHRRDLTLDAQGRFHIDGLVPGLKYHLAVGEHGSWKVFGYAFTDVVLAPGETRALGEVKLRPWPGK